MITFIKSYDRCFLEEKKDLYSLFLELTHYITVSFEAGSLFGELYHRGRRGLIEEFKEIYLKAMNFKKEILEQVLNNKLAFNAAVYPELWVKNPDCKIPPYPWIPKRMEEYILDLNTATIIDFMLFKGIDLKKAKAIVETREKRRGFGSIEEFQKLYPEIILEKV
ncbi:hypothetical protein BBF96_00685 [Anoxybacter fermentans]|uniref:Helix-hairpin-helix DNA-binding motif class 1 domain-containing protein n=2 Tax=Anoxybacter fermentans TaxID=1323375 RepID=A0A3S9SUT2_9FIRM|nr:hypothetical protein BBF96_00685 [Anoxybacter fermentans]